MAAGISTYLRFCNMADNRSFRPSSGIIRKRIDTFNHGKTFALQINHVRKDSILLNCDDGWLTSEIRLIDMGLCDEQDRSFALPNFARSVGMFKIIDREGTHPAFGMIAYLVYLPPSEFKPKRCNSELLSRPRNLLNFRHRMAMRLSAELTKRVHPL